MAVASQYGGDLAFRDAQERLSLCCLQAVVQDSRVHALFHPAQPRTGNTRAVEDALDRTVPDRVILVPDFQKQPRIDGCSYLAGFYEHDMASALWELSGEDGLLDAYKKELALHGKTAEEMKPALAMVSSIRVIRLPSSPSQASM